jgi:acyl transferase domain-containing protein
MADALCAAEPVFGECHRRGVDALLELGVDLRRALGDVELRLPSIQLPAIFLVEVALARLWTSWGIRPAALAGYSMGEITAAHLAGVLTFDDALRLVLARGRVLERASGGAMLSVPLPERDVAAMLGAELGVATVDTPRSCVVAGPAPAVDALAATLLERGVESRPVPIATAAHSRLLDPILAEWEEHVRAVDLARPSIPFVSNVTGTWITPEQAVDPAYWVRQLRFPVRFADGVATLLEEDRRVVLEVGPGRTLSGFVRRHPDLRPDQLAVASLRHPLGERSDVESVLTALGRLWLAGAEPDWRAAHSQRRRRVPLPTYPFEGERHWLDDRRGDHEHDDRAEPPHPVGPPEPPADDGPRTPVERTVAAIWTEVLGVRRVGLHDDFFELGGSSLLVTRAVALVNEACDVELSLLNLLESPTVAGFAECIEAVEQTAR